MNRPKVNDSLCFVCQENTPTFEATRGTEVFKLCSDCVNLVKQENETNNRVKKAMYIADTRKLFQYTLGLNLTPTQITFKQLGEI